MTLRVVIHSEFVAYTVERADSIVWGQHVHFGPTKRNRAGGYAFVAAAREQDRQGRLIAGDGERVEEIITNTIAV